MKQRERERERGFYFQFQRGTINSSHITQDAVIAKGKKC